MKSAKLVAAVLVVGVVLAQVSLPSHRDSASSFGLFHALDGPRAVYAEEEWKKEFDDICSKTEASTTLSKEQIRELISRGERLRTVISTLDDSTRKVYLKRLQMCLDLFSYALEMKEKN